MTGEIVGISLTLVVGEELNRDSLTSWASFWGVAGFPPGVCPVGPTLLVFGATIGIRAEVVGGALVVAGGVMASSDDGAASSLGRVSARA